MWIAEISKKLKTADYSEVRNILDITPEACPGPLSGITIKFKYINAQYLTNELVEFYELSTQN